MSQKFLIVHSFYAYLRTTLCTKKSTNKGMGGKNNYMTKMRVKKGLLC